MRNETFEETRARLRAHYGYDSVERALKHSADDTRSYLNWALREAYSSQEGHIYVRDFHDGWVVYEREWMVGDTFHEELLRRTYSVDASGIVTLGDEVEEVRPMHRTSYQPVRAFLTEVDGKTILTGPANAMLEKAMTGHPSVMWMKGRFVGAEKANRNGALWTTGDLEMGEPSVKFGPLNWLHSERHIIGAIAESALVRPTPLQVEAASGEEHPYIAAASAIWKWIYPQEAAVIEQASEQGKLWYSMECISERVHCGDCEGAYPYIDVVKASESVCDHIKGKTTTRRFENPTFLGGAAIVPPIRPGWSDAQAELVKQSASLVERAYDQAGQPDMPSSDWEQLMASVLSYAKG